jgi:Methyltransferase domain
VNEAAWMAASRLPIRERRQIFFHVVTSQTIDSVRQSTDVLRTLIEEARRRLYPSLTDPSYLVLRSRRLIFSRWAGKFEGRRLTILDIGGRHQPYRPLLEANAAKYIAIDPVRTAFVNAVASGEALPFAPETFDMVIATQVMDYFREPIVAVRQMHSVLKAGGTLLASIPACAPSFNEHERWRFTRAGVMELLSPFAEVEIVPELYSLGSVVRTLNLAMDSSVRYQFARSIYRRTGCPVLNLLGLGLEGLNLTSNDQFTANYSVRAVKG